MQIEFKRNVQARDIEEEERGRNENKVNEKEQEVLPKGTQ